MKRSFLLTVVTVNSEGQVDENSREIEVEMFVFGVSGDKRTAKFAFVFRDGGSILMHAREVNVVGATNIFSRGHDHICAEAEAVGLRVAVQREGGSRAFPGPVCATLFNLLMETVDESAAPRLSWE